MIEVLPLAPRRRRCLLLPALALGVVLSGCQGMPLSGLFGNGGKADPQANTLGALEPATLARERSAEDDDHSPRATVDLDEVIASYRALLPLIDDPLKRVQVRHRLADLAFQQAENALVERGEDDMTGAVAAYLQLLEEYPERAENDQVYYQLAKAYDLQGNSGRHLRTLTTLVERYPDSEFWVEAQFRRGELLFINGRYQAAEEAFAAVIEAGDELRGDDSFLVNAHYMKGWSQFKQGDYQPALHSYVNVLDLVMPTDQRIESVDRKNRTMVEDLFRVLGLSLSNLNGAETLQALFRRVGSRPYEVLVYDRYSALLLEREQYSDAIDVYQRYIDAHPDSPWSPRYHMRIIDTLASAGFTGDIPARKAGFVANYGITGDYWPQADAQAQAFIAQQLEALLPELASRHHLMAQRNEGEEARQDYFQAALYYAEFAETFPRHPRTPELLFLLGETWLELDDWPRAIEAFERVAYDFNDQGAPPARAAEAGYAAVLAFRQYAETWPREPREVYEGYLELQQLNRLRFVNGFADDERAIDVFHVAIQQEFDRDNHPEVVGMADRLISWQPIPPRSTLAEVRLLKAHSLYELERYGEAETAYQSALQALPDSDRRRNGIVENLAASVFRQAEALAAAGDTLGAVDEFLRVGAVAPAATLRANAEYDAASYLIELAHWPRAIEVMVAFRERYPGHDQIDTLPARLALAYRETEQWEKAGDELNTLFALADSDEEKRETLLIAAELYDRAGNLDKAIATYRQYANRYPAPLDQYMEAANRLAELYRETGNNDKRRFWLAKQMDAVDANPDATDDRMTYLAAEASAVLAREALDHYNGIRLTLPLNQSMAAKTEALERAVKAYQKTASYGISSLSTEAGYQIAHIYARLGSDLMDSERPEGLSELELAQYELLLEEQAYPFEDNAIDIHEQNASRSRQGIFDEWVRKSFEALKVLLPGRYDKPERIAEVVDELG